MEIVLIIFWIFYYMYFTANLAYHHNSLVGNRPASDCTNRGVNKHSTTPALVLITPLGAFVPAPNTGYMAVTHSYTKVSQTHNTIIT